MNLAKIEIIPHEKYENWFRVVMTSQTTAYGSTAIEIVCSAEVVRHIRNKCNDALQEKDKSKVDENPIFRDGKLKGFGE